MDPKKKKEEVVEGVRQKDMEATTDELFKEYLDLHKIDYKLGINRPQEREDFMEDERASIEGIIKGHLGKNKNNTPRRTLRHLKNADKKKISENLITALMYEYEKETNPNLKPEEMTEEHINRTIKDAGLQEVGITSYQDLIKHVMNSPSLRYGRLREGDPLKRLIDYVSLAKVKIEGEDGKIQKPGLRIQELQKQLTSDYRHQERLKELAAPMFLPEGHEYDPSATARDVLTDHDAYVQEQRIQYERMQPTTAKRPIEKDDKKKREYKLPDAA